MIDKEETEAGAEVGIEGEGDREEAEAAVGDIAEIGVAGIVGAQVAGKVDIDSLELQSEEGPDPHNVDRQ